MPPEGLEASTITLAGKNGSKKAIYPKISHPPASKDLALLMFPLAAQPTGTPVTGAIKPHRRRGTSAITVLTVNIRRHCVGVAVIEKHGGLIVRTGVKHLYGDTYIGAIGFEQIVIVGITSSCIGKHLPGIVVAITIRRGSFVRLTLNIDALWGDKKNVQ